MLVDYVTLDFHPTVGWIGIRELCGEDEQIVDGTDTMTAVRLIDRLLATVPGDVESVKASTMPAADRDKVLAAVYMRTYGPTIEATSRCSRCGSDFDLDFSLTDLQNNLVGGFPQNGVCCQGDGTYLLPSGHRFRIPTAEDEFAVAGMSSQDAAETLLRRCVMEGDPASKGDQVQTAMAHVAPLLEADLAAHCPECGWGEEIHFDIQSFLLRALQGEKSSLAWEVHRLASAYGWGLGEILSLTRRDRRTYVGFVERESSARRRFSV